MTRLSASLALFALITPAIALAVPSRMAHQGRLFDALGAPLAGPHTLTFTFYDAAASGTTGWTETLTTDFQDGYYAVILGETAPIDADDVDPGDTWMAITVDSGSELPDRILLNSVPYALVSHDLRGGVVDAAEIRVDGTTVIDSSGMIQSGLPAGVDDGDDDTLGDLSCGASELAVFSGSSWGCGSTPSHTHDAGQVTGTLAIDRLPIGTDATNVAAGDHNHDFANLLGFVSASQLPGDLDSSTTLGGAAISTGAHYTDAAAVAAMGAVSDGNPLNHHRLTESDVDGMVANNGFVTASDALTKTTFNDGFAYVNSTSAFNLSEGGWRTMSNFGTVQITTTGNPLFVHTSIQMNDDVGISTEFIAMACVLNVDGTRYRMGQHEYYGRYNFEWLYTYSGVYPVAAGPHDIFLECRTDRANANNMNSQVGNRGFEDPIGNVGNGSYQDVLVMFELGRQ